MSDDDDGILCAICKRRARWCSRRSYILGATDVVFLGKTVFQGSTYVRSVLDYFNNYCGVKSQIVIHFFLSLYHFR